MNRNMCRLFILSLFAVSVVALHAQPTDHCDALPSHSDLREALVAARMQSNGGFNLDMWGTIVNRDGYICAVVFTGLDRAEQWPGSRLIAAQKAYTANAFSLPALALSTANLYAAVQPGGSLYGLQHSNPINPTIAYAGNPENEGKPNDFLTKRRIGGVNVFGGGLGLYNSSGVLVGAIGVSGDSSCADHNIAWRTRNMLGLDYVPAGVSSDASRPDNIIFDMTDDAGGNPESAGGFGHPHCINAATEDAISSSLPAVSTP